MKAAFLALLGVVILLYIDKFVSDLKTSLADQVKFEETWTLLTILLWVLVAWLFVDAALTVALSFTEHKVTLGDLMDKLDSIDRQLSMSRSKPRSGGAGPAVTEGGPEEVPPPPVE